MLNFKNLISVLPMRRQDAGLRTFPGELRSSLPHLKQRKDNALFQVTCRVDALVVQADLKVAVVPGRVACAAHECDFLSLLNSLTDGNKQR